MGAAYHQRKFRSRAIGQGCCAFWAKLSLAKSCEVAWPKTSHASIECKGRAAKRSKPACVYAWYKSTAPMPTHWNETMRGCEQAFSRITIFPGDSVTTRMPGAARQIKAARCSRLYARHFFFLFNCIANTHLLLYGSFWTNRMRRNVSSASGDVALLGELPSTLAL